MQTGEIDAPAITAWRVSGTYFETCNCEAPSPCRRAGGRPTYDTCDFARSWMIHSGHYGSTRLEDLRVAIVGSWDNVETPQESGQAKQPLWRVILYLDDRGTPEQCSALARIFLGLAGGTTFENYARNIDEVYDVRSAHIELDHTPGQERLRIGDWVYASAARPYHTEETISRGIPEYDQPGQELVAALMRVHDGPLHWALSGRSGFASDFDFHSDN